ncbi:MAG: redoxin domain-containing protein [Candidatus Micrarchaeaceae archaeon]
MVEENKFPLIGEKFPEMQVETTQGAIKLPEQYRGRWFMLFSHPGDFTPVCTTEFYSFAKRYEDFQKLNTDLIGLSVDSTISHIEWVNWIEYLEDKHRRLHMPWRNLTSCKTHQEICRYGEMP